MPDAFETGTERCGWPVMWCTEESLKSEDERYRYAITWPTAQGVRSELEGCAAPCHATMTDSPGIPPGQANTELSTKGTLRGPVVDANGGGPGGAGPSDAGCETPAARGVARPARVADGGEP